MKSAVDVGEQGGFLLKPPKRWDTDRCESLSNQDNGEHLTSIGDNSRDCHQSQAKSDDGNARPPRRHRTRDK